MAHEVGNRARIGRVAAVFAVGLTSVACQIALASNATASTTTCTPDAGYSQCVALTYSGADQSLTLPSDAIPSDVLVKLWGAGGGGTNYSQMNGGAGGYTTGVLDLTHNKTVTVIVGQGGQSGCWDVSEATGSGVATYGGGGASAGLPPGDDANDWYCGASGGGRTAVRVGAGIANTSASDEVMTAGGGGGTSDGTGSVVELGGPGGGATGGDGACSAGCGNGPGAGGTQTTGGAPGLMTAAIAWFPPYTYISATAGSQFQGGTSGSGATAAAYETGGGGGGGYFGGGGGGIDTDPYDAPGGGGSGHADPIVGGGSTTASTTYTPPNTSEAQYVTGVGVGGGTGATNVGSGTDVLRPGDNGLAVFEFNLRPSVTIDAVTTGGVGPVHFNGTNGVTAQTLTTVTAATSVHGVAQTLTATATATTITQASVAGLTLTGVTCTGVGGGTATPNLAARTVTLDAAATVANATITCTFTSAAAPVLGVSATASVASLTVGKPASYTLKVTNEGYAATTAVATATAVVPAGLTLGALPPGCSVAGQTVTCTVSSGLAASAARSFVIPVTPVSTVATSASLAVSVTGGGDPSCPAAAHCTSSVQVTVADAADTLAQTGAPDRQLVVIAIALLITGVIMQFVPCRARRSR